MERQTLFSREDKKKPAAIVSEALMYSSNGFNETWLDSLISTAFKQNYWSVI